MDTNFDKQFEAISSFLQLSEDDWESKYFSDMCYQEQCEAGK